MRQWTRSTLVQIMKSRSLNERRCACWVARIFACFMIGVIVIINLLLKHGILAHYLKVLNLNKSFYKTEKSRFFLIVNVNLAILRCQAPAYINENDYRIVLIEELFFAVENCSFIELFFIFNISINTNDSVDMMMSNNLSSTKYQNEWVV